MKNVFLKGGFKRKFHAYKGPLIQLMRLKIFSLLYLLGAQTAALLLCSYAGELIRLLRSGKIKKLTPKTRYLLENLKQAFYFVPDVRRKASSN